MMVNMAIETAKMDFSSYIGLIIVALVFLIRMITSKKLPKQKAPSYAKPPIKREAPYQSPKNVYNKELPPVKIIAPTFAESIVQYKSASEAYHSKKKQVPRIQKIVKGIGSKKNLILISEIMNPPYL